MVIQKPWADITYGKYFFKLQGGETHTQALFQTLKSELKFPWETQPHHPFLHASTRHVDWPNSSPTFHFLFCHLFKTICFPHVSNCADSRSVGHANKGSSTVDEWTHKFDHTNRWSYSKLAVNWKVETLSLFYASREGVPRMCCLWTGSRGSDCANLMYAFI